MFSSHKLTALQCTFVHRVKPFLLTDRWTRCRVVFKPIFSPLSSWFIGHSSGFFLFSVWLCEKLTSACHTADKKETQAAKCAIARQTVKWKTALNPLLYRLLLQVHYISNTCCFSRPYHIVWRFICHGERFLCPCLKNNNRHTQTHTHTRARMHVR